MKILYGLIITMMVITFSFSQTASVDYNPADSPAQSDYSSNTLSENGWTTVNVSENYTLTGVVISYTWDTDAFPEEGAFHLQSPLGTAIVVASAESDGQYTHVLSDFNGENMNGAWSLWIEDIWGDGGHQASGITLTFNFGPYNPNPVPGQTALTHSGDLTWKFSGGTSTYVRWLGPTGSMVQVVSGASAGATGSYSYSGLDFLTEYEWQVIEYHDPETLNGIVWNFTTYDQLPDNPSPVVGAAVFDVSSTTLNWDDINGATYTIDIGTSPGDSNVVNDAACAISEYTHPVNWDTKTLYYWTVSAVVGGNSYPGSEWHFVTGFSGVSSGEIADFNDLKFLAEFPQFWKLDFTQTADIDAAESQYWDDADDNGDGYKYNDSNDQNSSGNNEGYYPIGNSSTAFKGNYNGNNHTISNLNIARAVNGSQTGVGLFGVVDSSQTVIENLALEDPDISNALDYTGSLAGRLANYSGIENILINNPVISAQHYAGGLAGQAPSTTGTIRNCRVINAQLTTTGNYIGGLCGYMYGTVENSSATGSATGVSIIGGLIGITSSDGAFYGSYSATDVSATSQEAGGLIGRSNGAAVHNCYAVGSVNSTNTSSDGGLIGTTNLGGEIQNCFFAGTSAGQGFIGLDNGSVVVTSCFWDADADGLPGTTPGSGNYGASGLSTADMKTLSTFTGAGWDFDNESANGIEDIWMLDGVNNNGYPFLSWEISGDAPLPVGLNSFTAISGDEKVTLKWTTESELDNDVFLLERSDDGKNFNLIAELEGRGTTSERTDYQFTDYSVYNGRTYSYRLGDRDINGTVTWHNTVEAVPNAVGISTDNSGIITNFTLFPAYPNPFNPETTIHFAVPNADNSLKIVKINVYNMLGQKIAGLYNGSLPGGEYKVQWNGKNNQNMQQPSGVYLVRFHSGQFVQTQKIILVR
ncbi:MAG: T9SS type A sorting domain-containing protein [Calditrichaceae bacterium]